MDCYDAYASMGKWQITSDKFIRPLLAYMLLGTSNSNFTQAFAIGATKTFTSAPKKGQQVRHR